MADTEHEAGSRAAAPDLVTFLRDGVRSVRHLIRAGSEIGGRVGRGEGRLPLPLPGPVSRFGGRTVSRVGRLADMVLTDIEEIAKRGLLGEDDGAPSPTTPALYGRFFDTRRQGAAEARALFSNFVYRHARRLLGAAGYADALVFEHAIDRAYTRIFDSYGHLWSRAVEESGGRMSVALGIDYHWDVFDLAAEMIVALGAEHPIRDLGDGPFRPSAPSAFVAAVEADGELAATCAVALATALGQAERRPDAIETAMRLVGTRFEAIQLATASEQPAQALAATLRAIARG
ncbi:hypothetical protein [Methyloraptor flagellatus]|uniref:Uncharacterized protein n=1 Tax=Methyloraptor flagellatus TaxID=3162530 RepID=A0AAU7X6D5_9HYPH